MKFCPDYYDEMLNFCLDDGTRLIDDPGGTGPRNVIRPSEEAPTRIFGDSSIPAANIPSARSPRAGKTNKGFIIAGLAGIILAALAGIYWYYYLDQAGSREIDSIAVLPFTNDSGNPELEYLSDGMTDTLITSLSQLSRLRVKARSTVFRYKDQQTDTKKIGRDLNVEAVLNGKVSQRGSDLTLHIELVDAADDSVLWSADYNRPLANLVALQTEIAKDVSDKLRIRLSVADRDSLSRSYTDNAEAYQLYLKGRYNVYKNTREGREAGIAYYEEAIAIAPDFALAYAGLSDAFYLLTLGSDRPSRELLPRAKEASLRAVQLGDHLPETHTSLGSILFWYDWDWKGAEQQFKRALELSPNDADARQSYAHLLSNLGRRQEALDEITKARQIDPFSLYINTLEGQFLLHAGRTDEAIERLKFTLELDPNYWLAHLFLASSYIEKGMYEEAVAEADQASSRAPFSGHPAAFRAIALVRLNKRNEAEDELAKLLSASSDSFSPSYAIAQIYNALGDKEKTFEWLEIAIRERNPKMTFIKVEPKWNNLRDDARFRELMQKAGFAG